MNAYLAKHVIEIIQSQVATIRELEAEVAQLKAERDHFETVAIESQIIAHTAKKALADQIHRHDRERRKWANKGQ